jgi:hypothetical protein
MALCEWCRRRRVERRGARYCSHPCRQRAYEFRVRVSDLTFAIEAASRHVEMLASDLRAVLAGRHIITLRIPKGGH